MMKNYVLFKEYTAFKSKKNLLLFFATTKKELITIFNINIFNFVKNT